MFLVTNPLFGLSWRKYYFSLLAGTSVDVAWIVHWALCGICISVHRKSAQNILHFGICLHTMSKTQIKPDLRVLSFCLGLYSIETFNLGVGLNTNQSGFINELCLTWARVLGIKNWSYTRLSGVLSLTFMGPEHHPRCKIHKINQFVTMPPNSVKTES